MAEFGDILPYFRSRKPYSLRVILLCTAAATTFWFLNALNKEHTTTLDYPLEFLYDSDTYMAIDDLPPTVMINVNSNGWNLLKNSLGIKISPLQIALTNPQDQKKIAASSLPSLISEQLNDFELNYILIDTLRLNLDRRATRTLLLSVDSTNLPLAPLHKRITPITIEPDSITIKGPQSMVNALKDTIELDLGEGLVDEDFQSRINVPIIKDHLDLSADEVQVEFDVITLIERSYMVPVQTKNDLDSTLSIFPDQIMVFVLMPESVDGEIQPEDFLVEVDYSTVDEDSAMIPIITEFPARVESVRTDSLKIQLVKN